MPLPQVAIIGRMNTGKSTLFNRLTESRRAIMSNVPGTTRDRSILPVTWQGLTFELIDTGGVDIDAVESFKLLGKKTLPKDITSVEKQVIKQTQKAIRQAHLLLLVVDGQVGVTPSDREIVKILRQAGKPVLLVCNKIDSQKYEPNIKEFLKLGMGQPQAVSAANGTRTGDLLDLIVKNLKKLKIKKGRAKPKMKQEIAVSIIGKPNVGKSSLLNALAGEERVIVSPQPQTTREPQDIVLEYKDTKFKIVDTAGIKRKAKVLAGIDSVATSKAIESMRASDIVLFMLDANEPITSQDKSLAGLIEQSLAGAIVVINKWDAVAKTATLNAHYKKLVAGELPPLKWAPLIFLSAKTGQSVNKLFDIILDIVERRQLQVSTVDLYDFLKRLLEKKRPVGGIGIERPRISRLEQTKTNPPEFLVRLGINQRLDESYVRFIENSLRKKYHLEGINIKINVTNQ